MTADAAAARALLDLAITYDWPVAWLPSVDSGGNPYVTVRGRHPDGRAFEATWHTRATGTYRLFSAAIETRHNSTYRDAPMRRVQEYITTPKENRR